jgi:hypothetical protein
MYVRMCLYISIDIYIYNMPTNASEEPLDSKIIHCEISNK